MASPLLRYFAIKILLAGHPYRNLKPFSSYTFVYPQNVQVSEMEDECVFMQRESGNFYINF